MTTFTKESVGKALMPYFKTGNGENNQVVPLKVENGYATISLPDAEYGFSHLPYGYLNSKRKENLTDSASCQRSLHIHDRMS